MCTFLNMYNSYVCMCVCVYAYIYIAHNIHILASYTSRAPQFIMRTDIPLLVRKNNVNIKPPISHIC